MKQTNKEGEKQTNKQTNKEQKKESQQERKSEREEERKKEKGNKERKKEGRKGMGREREMIDKFTQVEQSSHLSMCNETIKFLVFLYPYYLLHNKINLRTQGFNFITMISYQRNLINPNITRSQSSISLLNQHWHIITYLS